MPPAAEVSKPKNNNAWENPTFCGGWAPDPAATVIVIVYLILNLCLNYYNAFLLGGGDHGHLHLPIPIFYTMLHQITIVVFTSIWCAFVPSVRFPVVDTFSDNWAWLIFVSVIYASSIATNNASFASISLTVNTIFKSAMPFPTMVFSYFVEGKTYSLKIILIVAVLVGGTLLAVPYGDHKPDSDTPEWIGYVLVIFSMVATAVRPVVSSHLMRNAEAKGSRKSLTAVSMAFFDASIAICVLLPVALVTDVIMNDGVQQVFVGNDYALRNVGYISLGCLMAGIYGPVTFYTIKLTSSLTFIIIGNFKQLFLLCGAAFFVDHVVEPMLIVGVLVTAAASLVYSYQTNKEKADAAEAAAKKKEAEQKLLATESTPLRRA